LIGEIEMIKNMKFLAILMAVLAAFVLTACGGGATQKLLEEEDAPVITIAASAKYGQTLYVSVHPAKNVKSIQWMRNGSFIYGAMGNTYTVRVEDIGQMLTAFVTTVLGNTYMSTTVGPIAKADGPFAPAGLKAEDKMITGLDPTKLYEYSANRNTWTDVPANSSAITGLNNDAMYYVRIKETATHLAGEMVAVGMPGTLLGDVSITGGSVPPKFGETLTMVYNVVGPTYSVQWKRSGADITGKTWNYYTLAADDIGHKIKVVITGTGNYAGTLESAETAVVDKADGPAAPAGLVGVAPATAGGSSGMIAGLDSAKFYQYKKVGGSDWSEIASASITNLEAGSYQVRIKETATHKAGAVSEVTVPECYSVKFNMQGYGTAPETQNIASGGKVTEPNPAPTASGCEFAGWYKEKKCKTAWNFATDTVTANTILFAKWLVEAGFSVETSVVITLDYTSNGKVVPQPNEKMITLKKGATTLGYGQAPVLDGKTLDGFYADPGCTYTKVAEADGTLVLNVAGYTGASGWIGITPCILYAKWK